MGTKMGKREEMMREDEPTVFSARGSSGGKRRSAEKENERGGTEG